MTTPGVDFRQSVSYVGRVSQINKSPATNALTVIVKKLETHGGGIKGFSVDQLEPACISLTDTRVMRDPSAADAIAKRSAESAEKSESILNFCVSDEQEASSESHILRESIPLRIGSNEFMAMLNVLGRMWRILFSNLRVFGSTHDFEVEGFGVWSTGHIIDVMEEKLHEIIGDPDIMWDPQFCFFELREFPWLREYQIAHQRATFNTRDRSRTLRVIDVERDILFGEEALSMKDLIDKFTVAECEGILASIDRNCRDFLSRTEGKFRDSEFSSELKTMLNGAYSDNTTLTETHFGVFKYIFRDGVNYNISSVSSLVEAMHGKLYDNVPEIWNLSHTKACIRMVKDKALIFRCQELNRERKQLSTERDRLRQKKLAWEVRVQKQHLETLSYYLVPTIRTIDTVQKLHEALDSLKAKETKRFPDTKRKAFLKFFLNACVIGYNWKIFAEKFSSKSNPELGNWIFFFHSLTHKILVL